MSRRPKTAALIGPVADLTEELKASNTAALVDGECSICYGEFAIGEEVAYSEACVLVRSDGTISRHIYHKECMQQLVNSRSLGGRVPCPACRKILSADDMAAFGARNLELGGGTPSGFAGGGLFGEFGLLRDAPVVRRTPRVAGGGLFGGPIINYGGGMFGHLDGSLQDNWGDGGDFQRPDESTMNRLSRMFGNLDGSLQDNWGDGGDFQRPDEATMNRLSPPDRRPGFHAVRRTPLVAGGGLFGNLDGGDGEAPVSNDASGVFGNLRNFQPTDAANDDEFLALNRMNYPSWLSRMDLFTRTLTNTEQAAFDSGITYFDFVQSQIRIQGTRVVIKKEFYLPRTQLESIRQLDSALHRNRFPGDEEAPSGIVERVEYFLGRQGPLEYAIVMFESLVVAEFGTLVDSLGNGKVRVPLSWLDLPSYMI